MGVVAETIKNTDSDSKGKLGRMAYVVQGLNHIFRKRKRSTTYHLDIDGKKRKVRGQSLIVNNAGNIGIEGKSLVPGVDISDGLLDIVVIKRANLITLLQIFISSLLGKSKPQQVKHFKGKNIIIKTNKSQKVIRDDVEAEYKDITINILPLSLEVLIP